MKRAHRGAHDDGSVLIMVLVMMVIGAMVVVPLIAYTTTVFRAGKVQTDKARAVEMARGGTWVALNNEAQLFNICNGGALPSSLAGVSTTCQVLSNATQRPLTEVPYHVAAVQSDVTLPPELTSADSYVNINSTSPDPNDWDKWLDTPDWNTITEAGKIWLPQMPVQATSAGGTRDTTMTPGTEETFPQDYTLTGCRVFFPGTFSSQITIDEPVYFTSGVYYFTEPIVLESGADVVVGNGAAGGCTTDFEAISFAQSVPDPLNMSGVGGTFVFGENARLVVDDSSSGNIRFAMNQRYVSEDETSVAASSGVSIVSVNGTHEPLLPMEALGDDLLVDGVIAVPASTVGTDGDPLAAASDYDPSVLTPKPTEPDAPTNVQITRYQETFVSGNDGVSDGMVTVTWDIPNENGALITEYVATESRGGLTCSPPAPTLPDTSVQPSCTIYGISHMDSSTRTDVTVQAKNDVGWSPPSDPSNEVRVDLRGTNPGNQAPQIGYPTEPLNPAVGTAYSDGLEIVFDPPADDGGSAITHYKVTAIDTVTSAWVTCEAWWDETSCILRYSDGLTPGSSYDVFVEAVVEWDGNEFLSPWAELDFDLTDNALPVPPNIEPDPVLVTPGIDPAPVQVPAVATARMPEPILDFTTTSGDQTEISIAGYVAVPQGHIAIGAAVPAATSITMSGGLVAGQVLLDPSGVPSTLSAWFDNPIAQKRVRIRSTASGDYTAVSDAVVQVNKSGSIAINSWVVQ